MNSEHKEYRAGLYERRNNRSGKTEWVVRFTHPSAPSDAGKVAWFDVAAGNSYFVDPEDCKWFAIFINYKKNIAIRFERLPDAYGFLEKLRPAEKHNEGQAAAHAP